MHAITDRQSLISALDCRERQFTEELIAEGGRIKRENVGTKTYLRGLIEISNKCRKDCLYCGIRCSNVQVERYEMSEEEIISCALKAMALNYGSICIQSGERCDKAFTDRISSIIRKIKALTDGRTGITLSLGEQSRETLMEWFEAGAHRYLLRIEASNPMLYRRLHPENSLHSYDTRLKTLYDLKEIGYQVGSGVMIGLPYQTPADLADDLLFLKNFDIDMVGMGPYIPHPQTPLAALQYPADGRRLELSLKMVALLRMLMPKINIAATTALEVLDKKGREKALAAGANIVMPNISPASSKSRYSLYDKKTSLSEDINLEDAEIGFGEWGDSLHFLAKRADIE